LLVGVITFIGWRASRPPAAGPAPATSPAAAPVSARRVIAALGFKNASGRADVAWAAPVLTRMLTGCLEGSTVRVVAPDDVERVGRELGGLDTVTFSTRDFARWRWALGVDAVVVGSYEIIGSATAPLLRVTASIHDGSKAERIADGMASGAE